MDGSAELRDFAGRLEEASLAVINGGVMTADLAALCEEEVKTADSAEFIGEIGKLLKKQ
jgi:isocitrate dehydrogenase